MRKPIIIIQFNDQVVTWASMGWGNDEALRKKAKEAINKGEMPQEVVALLDDAGFEVRIQKSA